MSSLIVKRLSSFSPSSFHHYHLALLTPLLRLSFSTQTPEQKEISFMAKYLISSFGFSPDRALRYSTEPHLTAIKSCDRPESVVRFLKETGLSDTQIKAAVSFHPPLLGSNVEKTLKPKVRELMDEGFSGELLVQLIRHNPVTLLTKHTLSRLLFWKDFVGNCDQALLKLIQKTSLLITYDVDKHVVPRINLLNEYELSNRDILSLIGHGNRCMSCNLDSLRQTLELIEELGIPRGSNLFLYGLNAIRSFGKDKIQKKVEFYKRTYGWSKEEVYSAFRKFPHILGYSEEKIKSNIDFLIRQAKLEPRSIASQPQLIGYSLVNRLVPRHQVLSILAAKGLGKGCSLLTACRYSDKRFLEKYVEPYKKDLPELADAYFASSDRNLPVIYRRGFRMFLYGVKAVGAYNKDKLDRNVEFFKRRYGWSQEEVCVVFKKCHCIQEVFFPMLSKSDWTSIR